MLTQLENLARLSEFDKGSFAAHNKFSREALALLTRGAMKRALNQAEEPLALIG